MIFVILLLGLALRLVSLNQSLWLDESTSAMVAKMSSVQILHFLRADFHPPLYYFLLKIWASIFGFSEVSLRFPSIIFALGTIYLVYKISKNYYAPLFLAISGLSVYYSQEARMYSMAAFFVALTMYLFIKKRWILFSLGLLLVGMSDYIALFIAPVFLLIGWKDRKRVILSYLPIVASFFLWLPVFLMQIKSGVSIKGTSWGSLLGSPSFKNVALIPVKFILGRISFDNKFIYTAIVAFSVVFFGFILYKARKSLALIWIWLLVPIAIGILISFVVPTLSYFRFIFCLPALYILLAEGINKSGKFKYIFLSIVLVINSATSFYYLLTPKFYREDWRDAAKAIGGDKIVFPVDSQKEALIYYGKGGQIIFTNNLTKSDKEIWLSRYVWEIFDPNDLTRKKIESLGYNKVSEMNFNGVVFFKYENSN